MNENKNIRFRFLSLAFILLIAGGTLLFYGFRQNENITEKPAEINGPQVIPSESQLPQISDAQEEGFVVNRVVDGDTIVLESGEKVRYIGIDTPETVDPRRPVACFGKEASNENKKLVEGKIVYLTKDISEKDQFGRLLRLVYLKQSDGSVVFVNDYLVRYGFAKVSTYPPDVKFTSQFIEAEKEARENQRGLWQKCL